MVYCPFCGFLLSGRECRNCGSKFGPIPIISGPTKQDYAVQNEERIGYDQKGNRVKV